MYELQSLDPDTGRQVISVRAQPALKQNLTHEAIRLGITLSQHVENIISTRQKIKKDLDDLRVSNEEKQKEIDQLKVQLESKSVTASPPFLQDQRLVFLFDKLKDKNDTVEDAYGENFKITYKQPDDVLKAIIYSTKLKT